MAELLERLAQGLAGPGQARLDGVEVDLESGRDVLVVELVVRAQDQDGAVVRLELADGTPYHGGLCAAFELVVGPDAARDVDLIERLGGATTELVQGQPSRDGQD